MLTPRIGDKVRVKSNASGSDQRYAGRTGIVARFDPQLPWTSPRALLAPDHFVCVHFMPRTAGEFKRGSPLDLIDENNLTAMETDRGSQ